MSYLFDVYGVAIEKLEYYEVVPMSELLFDTEPENVPTEDGLWERPAE
jgi:hypothetical protein